MLTIAITAAPKNAVQNPLTWKPGDNIDEASISISALITRRNMPNVRIEIGIVIILRNNPIVAFIRPIITAARRAVPIPSTTKPGMMYDTIKRLAALIIH